MSPSTHQDSPKVLKAEKLEVCLRCGEVLIPGGPGCFRDSGIGHSGPFRFETYIPVSALLSDEVVERLAERIYGRMTLPFDERYAEKDEEVEARAAMHKAREIARADLQAALDTGGSDA